MRFPQRTVAGLLAGVGAGLGAPAAECTVFHTSSGQNQFADIAFQKAVGPTTFEESDLDAYSGNTALSGILSKPSNWFIKIDLGQNLIPGGGGPMTILAPTPIPTVPPGTIANTALINQQSLASTFGYPQIQFRLFGATAFGAWVLDDSGTAVGACRLIVRDYHGNVCISDVIDAQPSGHPGPHLEGFLGAVSAVGIEVAAVEVGTWDGVNQSSFIPSPLTTAPKFRVDHLQLGFEITCPTDFNLDGIVNGADLGLLAAAWGSSPPACGHFDLNGDGVVDGMEWGLLLASWGPCP